MATRVYNLSSITPLCITVAEECTWSLYRCNFHAHEEFSSTRFYTYVVRKLMKTSITLKVTIFRAMFISTDCYDQYCTFFEFEIFFYTYFVYLYIRRYN